MKRSYPHTHIYTGRMKLGFLGANTVTNDSARLDKRTPISVSPENETPSRRSGQESIQAGLEWLASRQKDGYWSDFTMLERRADVWVTAYVVARLGEVPAELITHAMPQQIQSSLNWLEKVRLASSGWSSSGSTQADAFTTAWSILALRMNRRGVARSALDFLLSCRQANGGFSVYPHGVEQIGNNPSLPEVTVTALRALSMCDSAAEEFLGARLKNELPGTSSARISRLYCCAEILDWETGLASWPVLNRAGQCTAQFDLEKPYEQALLLRSLVRLRNQRAWPAAAELRKMQLQDGAWPGCSVVGPVAQSAQTANPVSFADSGVVSTATAIAALVLSEAQPGLYFGSDMPTRRYREQ